MVLVVKWLRPRIVIPIYVGSNPIMHPRMYSTAVVHLLHTEQVSSSNLLITTNFCWGIAKRQGIGF